jgi:hypothetical protein
MLSCCSRIQYLLRLVLDFLFLPAYLAWALLLKTYPNPDEKAAEAARTSLKVAGVIDLAGIRK